MRVAIRYIIMYTNEQSDKAYDFSQRAILTHAHWHDVRYTTSSRLATLADNFNSLGPKLIYYAGFRV